MDKDIASYIIENSMLRTGDCVIAAVSGGADSMCMLFCLTELSKEMSLQVRVLHVNHGIRGAEADADEAFVREYCENNSIPFSSVHADVPSIALETGKTLEEAGREIRYNALFEEAAKHGAAAVALAHNLSDRAETVLLNLLRGSGITGGAGIRPVSSRNGIKLIRPLLSTSRSRIEEILGEAGIKYRTDSTNLSDDHTRNRLRRGIFPLLTGQVNPRAVEHLCNFAQDMADVSDFVETSSRQVLDKALASGEAAVSDTQVSISVILLMGLHPALVPGVLRLLIPKLTSSLKDISRTHISSITDLICAGTSKTVSLPYGLYALRTRDRIVIGVSSRESEMPPAGSFFTVKKYSGDDRALALSLIEKDLADRSSNKNCTKWFDYDNIDDGLMFRYPLPGDTIPVLLGGTLRHKEVLKVFREAGITAAEAKNIPVAVCGDDVIWIPGIRRCDAYRVSADTLTIIEISCNFCR